MSTPDAKRTPLHEVHAELGAMITEFAGYLMPLRYGSESAEHQAVRTSAGLFDLSHMGEIFVTGPQAGAALDHALIGHLSMLGVGRARYTMIVNSAGGVLDDLIVYRLAPETYMVVANAANAATVRAELTERSEGFEKATVDDRSAAYALIAVQGPKAQAILAKLTDAALADLKYYAILPGKVAGIDALIARTGYTGEDGFELFVGAGDAVAVWNAVAEAGGDDLRPAGLSARDTLRLEAGMPLYGNELTAETTPYDAGLGRTVKLDKPGDFVGRAALAALADTPPGRTLVGLVGRGRRVPRHGYDVVTPDGTPCGVVTSGAPSPTLGRPIAMAYIDAGHADDTDLAVDIRGKHEPVDKVALPFYRRTS
ncbi:glycine cleavage system aminomethyltransferase GcvT [Actinoallomurus rhizosphaericola]|uniref:glycine cleavage system aminomethyltransferase GcvT n=1 Tax=Actinoallomurus rhizosphaericola TaxID=2952536 RepID=UPI002090832E|nr:glycine cleavage system aminomethyltransferase GcvT [Actinoallomurus rhizosphaericola]MCO5994073.1 glycine cleavage system aminomethyltransferase GcvT [Actinoallomurus rhizosphaericola]